ncbi:DUF1183-domain-containing protein, partial [Patellaria atrata CBS 101060]
MQLHDVLPLILLFHTTPSSAARKPSNSVLLSNIKTLTLRKGLKTSHRRVPAVPQLQCVGGSAKGIYEVDVMRCTNSGSDYDDDNVQWTCTASLPEEFKLGSTDVFCEGYDSPEDPYVLKGSCGVEYRLVLTEKGEEKYGRKWTNWGKKSQDSDEGSAGLIGVLFWILFFAVAAWMVYLAFFKPNGGVGGPQGPQAPRWGGGGSGGGGGDDDDPPPPYDHLPPRSKYTRSPTSQESWRPGFWSGAAAGAGAAYMAGRGLGRSNNTRETYAQPSSSWFGGGRRDNGGEGSSRGASSPSTSRYESTGFGSTRRR